MLHTIDGDTPRAALRAGLPHVGDNLDRLLGLLEAARDEQASRAAMDREASYWTLAAAIADPARDVAPISA